MTDENLQSRIRGVVLMALSNANGWIVLTTGNKSEMATGYSTLYGDSAGGFAVIKDVPKTLVYALCRHRNRRAGFDLIPDAVLTKAPSAELRPDQRDDESLPPYSVLDPVVAGYVEGDRSPDDLIAEGFDPEAVAQVVGLVDRAEYKRRQMPPGVRISAKAFGKDRRMPITNHYRAGGTADPARRPGDPGGRLRPLSELTDPTRAIPAQAAPPTEAVAPAVASTDPAPPADLPSSAAAPAAPGLPLTLGPPRRWWGSTAGSRTPCYSLLGQWVTDMPVAAVQIHLDAQSLRHAWHADLWADRLPVLSGVDPAGLTVPSPSSAALFAALDGVAPGTDLPGSTWPPADEESLARPGALPRLAGLYRVVLPRLVTSYERHLRVVSPVTDAPVARALRLVLNDEIEDWHAGERLVQRLMTRPHDVAAVHEFLERLESAVVGAESRSGLVVFPPSVPED